MAADQGEEQEEVGGEGKNRSPREKQRARRAGERDRRREGGWEEQVWKEKKKRKKRKSKSTKSQTIIVQGDHDREGASRR